MAHNGMIIYQRMSIKTMTCRELGGACELKFQANTFEEMAQLSKAHAMEMFQQADAPHLQAMNEMKELMQDPKEMQAWFEDKKAAFKALEENH